MLQCSTVNAVQDSEAHHSIYYSTVQTSYNTISRRRVRCSAVHHSWYCSTVPGTIVGHVISASGAHFSSLISSKDLLHFPCVTTAFERPPLYSSTGSMPSKELYSSSTELLEHAERITKRHETKRRMSCELDRVHRRLGCHVSFSRTRYSIRDTVPAVIQLIV